ncbi:MAG: DUF3307 domain-containing protein [Solirubrobacteraceae bacterium]|nr:DUF3307 domain-containing protein [Solirubrobacteraceae bacterium]
MTWIELFAALIVAHLVGDFLLQTEAQACAKAGGMGRNPVARRALGAHILSYGVAMAAPLAWVAVDQGIGVALIGAAVILVPHAIQDDRRLIAAYARHVKRTDPESEPLVMFGLDQSLHIVALFGTALLLTA